MHIFVILSKINIKSDTYGKKFLLCHFFGHVLNRKTHVLLEYGF
jgi:hypothetical protein